MILILFIRTLKGNLFKEIEMIRRTYWIQIEVKHMDGGGHFECSNIFSKRSFIPKPNDVLNFAIENMLKVARGNSKELFCQIV